MAAPHCWKDRYRIHRSVYEHGEGPADYGSTATQYVWYFSYEEQQPACGAAPARRVRAPLVELLDTDLGRWMYSGLVHEARVPSSGAAAELGFVDDSTPASEPLQVAICAEICSTEGVASVNGPYAPRAAGRCPSRPG